MKVFLEDKIEISSSQIAKDALYSKNPEKPILAIIREKEVQFLDSKLKEAGQAYISVKKIKAVSWSPIENKLVIGNEDGLVSFYDPINKELREETGVHSSEITRIDFSLNGKLMLTQDKDFNVIFWKEGNPIKEHFLDAPLNVVLFVNFLHVRKDKINKNVKLCFLGDKMGKISYFEEKKMEVQELCKINGSIKELFYYSKTNSIVVVTSTYYLIQFRISTEDDIIPDKKVKISMDNSSENLMGAWIAPSTFVLNSKDPVLKFWNVETGNNYAINIAKLQKDLIGHGSIKVLELKYDAFNGQLNLLLSNHQIFSLNHKKDGMVNEADDWNVAESPETLLLENVVKMIVGDNKAFTLLCKDSVHVFSSFRLKLFLDLSKNLKFLLKSQTQVEFFEQVSKEVKTIDFQEPFLDFLVSDQTLVILNKNREIIVSTVFELIGSASRLTPVVSGTDYSFGLKKFNKIHVSQTNSEIFLSKFGFVTIINDCRILFCNYKTSVNTDFCHPDPTISFTDLVFNNLNDHFLMIDESKKVRVFQTTQSNFRLLHDNIDICDYLPQIDTNLLQEMTNPLTDTFTSRRVSPKIECIALSDIGDKLLVLFGSETNNLICLNISKRISHVITLPNIKTVQKVAFSKTDNRFFAVVSKNGPSSNPTSVAIYVLDEDKFHLFDTINSKPDQHYLDLNFPEVFFSFRNKEGETKVDVLYCQLFKKLLNENEQNVSLKTFTRNFCFNLVFKKLSKALTELKKIEKSFELEEFWISLFNKSLDIKNLKMAELCLSKIKFVRGKLFSEIQTTEDCYNDSRVSNESEKLGNLCLCFNNIEQAKRIFLEERNYFKITEILFLEENYDALLKFCCKHDKSLLNFYYLKIGATHLKLRNYCEFFAVCKKAKVTDEFVLRMLEIDKDFEFVKRLCETEGWYQANSMLAKFHHNNGNLQLTRKYLEQSPENKSALVEFTLKAENNFEAAKAMSVSFVNDASASSVSICLAQHKAHLGDNLGAVEQLVKGQHYLKVIKYLQDKSGLFENNEDFKNKIVDILYNLILQNSKHYAAGAVADYLLSIEMYEKACLVCLKSEDVSKAKCIATNFNLNHLMNSVESAIEAAEQKSQVEIIQPKERSLKRSYTQSSSLQLANMIESGRLEEAMEIIELKMNEIQIGKEELVLLKRTENPLKMQVLKLAAKNCKKHGRGFPIQFKDATFNSILSFFVKAKKLGKAIDFLRNFSVDLFDSGCVGECLETVEKAKGLAVKLSEEDSRGYLTVLNDDQMFVEQYIAGVRADYEVNNLEALNIFADLRENHKTSLFGNSTRVLERFFVSAVKTEMSEKAIELGNLISRNKEALRSLLGQNEFDQFSKMISKGDVSLSIDREAIEEELE